MLVYPKITSNALLFRTIFMLCRGHGLKFWSSHAGLSELQDVPADFHWWDNTCTVMHNRPAYSGIALKKSQLFFLRGKSFVLQ